MVSIVKTANNNVEYLCECGTTGRCLIRPFDDKDVLVVDIACAFCAKSSRVVLTKEESTDVNEADMSFAIVLSNKIVKPEE